MASLYGTARWRKIRLYVLERDGYECQIHGPTCTLIATLVDHIHPPDKGGAMFDPSNLRAACAGCNNWRAQRPKRKQERWQRSEARIVLVISPPGACSWAGDYVNDNLTDCDVVIDYSRIARALGNPDSGTVRRVRNALLDRMRRGQIEGERVFLTSTNPDAVTLFPHHELVVVDPGYESAREGCPEDVLARLDEWYQRREGPRVAVRRRW